ncbi:MmcQ/YjbR family DNA-binding protein [Oceaniglobus trochenteri]|uniref:MmcQ/YjbR family DNA-binding protein n=1 Tax=Oceaniglobus trochenteri TaxID=2763260 RepID=UPI001CFF6A74|nr:MmcQ/YjbR family DNA-binding protein [Oceaniglobus trochenteri]
MDRSNLTRICKALPGATCSDPWGGGHDAWKVGDKMFALVGAQDLGVSVKCADTETAQMLIEVGLAVKAPYIHRSWVLLTWEGLAEDELRHRVETSYDLIRAGLPKKVQAALDKAPHHPS